MFSRISSYVCGEKPFECGSPGYLCRSSTSCPGSRTGSLRNKSVLVRLKIAVLAPMPRARADGDGSEARFFLIGLNLNCGGPGAKTFLILAGSNAAKGYDDLDHRFDCWPAPSIALLNGNWVGELSAMSVITGGTGEIQPPLKLKGAADAQTRTFSSVGITI